MSDDLPGEPTLRPGFAVPDDARAADLRARSCPTCQAIGANPECADPWHQPRLGTIRPDGSVQLLADMVKDGADDPVDEAARVVAQPIADLHARVAELEQAVANLIEGAPSGSWRRETLRDVIIHRARELIEATDIPVIGVDVISMFLDTPEGTNPAPVLVIWARGGAGLDSTLLSWHALPGWTPGDNDTPGTPGLGSIVRKMADQLRQGRATQLRTSAPGVINHRATTHWAP